MTISPATILAGLAPFFESKRSPVKRYWIAYSGGLDSHVLLHALTRQRELLTGACLEAVHINHALSPNAKQWAEHCAQQCARLRIPLHQITVNARAGAGASPEAAARAARYQALAELLQAGDCLLTAHHQDDQAETLLLQLLRGAGPKGLAAMPLVAAFAGGWHARPLLGVRRDEIQRYAQQQQLAWIDDESNFDTGFDRNFLRHDIMPRLMSRFPAVAQTLSRSAALCSEAAEILAETATSDITAIKLSEQSLSATGLRKLGEVRGRNALHHWIHACGLPVPSAAHLQRLWQDVVCSAVDSEPSVAWAGAQARRYRDQVFVSKPLSVVDVSQCFTWDGSTVLNISGLGALSLQAVSGQGISAENLAGQKLEVRFRQGGERIQPAGRQGHHSLKKLFQEAGIPPWQRERIPLLYLGDELIAVAGLWIAQEVACKKQQQGFLLVWSENNSV